MSRWKIDHFQVRTLVSQVRSYCDMYLTLTQSDAGTKSIVREMEKAITELSKVVQEESVPDGYDVETRQTEDGMYVIVSYNGAYLSTVVKDGDTDTAIEYLRKELEKK